MEEKETHSHTHSCWFMRRKTQGGKFLNEHKNIHKRDIHTSKHTKTVFVGGLFSASGLFLYHRAHLPASSRWARCGLTIMLHNCTSFWVTACTAAWPSNHLRPRGLKYWSLLYFYFSIVHLEMKSYECLCWKIYFWNHIISWSFVLIRAGHDSTVELNICLLTLFKYINFSLTVLCNSLVHLPLETWLKKRSSFFRFCRMTVDWREHTFHRRALSSSFTAWIRVLVCALVWQN